jgi:hypothetical protein
MRTSDIVWQLRYCAIASSTVMILVVLAVAANFQRHLRLKIRKQQPDPNHIIVGAPRATTYTGMLRNTGEFPVLVQVIPIIGRNSTSGRFGPCYLEQWNSTLRGWVYSPPPVVNSEAVPVNTFTLKAGEAIRACGATFLEEPEQPEACYRFALQLQIKGFSSPSIISSAFKTGVPVGKSMPSPCQS